MTAKERYCQAHYNYQCRVYPSVVKDGHYTPPKYPKILTSNGMMTYISNLLNWLGHRCTRINVSGRLIEAPQKQASGVSLMTKKYMHSSTRKGTADLSSTIKINGVGRSVMWEIKAGNDRPSENQLEEQKREQEAGGEYFFVHSIEDFLTIYDGLL